MAAKRIDVHHHYLPAELIGELDRVGIDHVGGRALAPAKPSDSLPVPLTLDDAAASRRVARMVNEAGAEAVAGDPERFGLLVTLPLPDVDGAMDEIAYALDVLRADGVVLLSNHVFYDVTLSTGDAVLGCLHDLVPSTHVVLGTDYPMAQEIGVASTLAGPERHGGFDDDDRRAIGGDSARRRFPRLDNWAGRIPRARDFAT